MAKILAVGGTGLVGSAVVTQLLKDGHEIRVLTRQPSKALAKFGERVETMEGDATNAQNAEAAVAGMDVVFSALSAPPGKKNINTVEYVGNITLMEACKLKRVKRFVYVSILNAEYLAGVPRFFVKYRVEEELKISGLTYTIFRPTLFMESLPLMIDQGKVIIYGNQPNPVSFTAVADFANIVAASLSKLECFDKVFDVLGPEKLTFDDVLGSYKRVRRPNLKVKHMSLLWGKVLGYLMLLSKPELSEHVAMMNEFEQTPESGDPSVTYTLLPQPTIRFQEWLLSL